MSQKDKSLDAGFFNKMYEKNPDPWDFENSTYEREKYAATISMIPGNQYENAFEIGCSNGILTEMLLGKCKNLLAVDASSIAIDNAKRRLAGRPNVKLMEMTIPNQFPHEKFDLILFSEIGYFMNQEDLIIARQKILDALVSRGHLLLVHWTPYVEEFPLTGDQVHEIFNECAGEVGSQPLTFLDGKRESQYRMDLYQKK